MSVNVTKIRKLRRYSEDFKRMVVKAFESGKLSVKQLEKLYGVANPTIYGWIYKFSTFNEKGYRVIEMKESAQSKLTELSNKVQQLEQAVGQKQIMIDYLEKLIDLAKADLDIDIKKLQYATVIWFKNNRQKINYSLNSLYNILGITKQSVSQYERRRHHFESRLTMLMNEAEDLRKEHPGCGLEKMYYSLNPSFIGRDKFIEVFTGLGFRLNKKINYKRTTYSTAADHPNLIKGMEVCGPSEIWQTDITYYEVSGRFYYLIFIIDVYTKIIVGYSASDNMRATANIKAIEKAFREHAPPLIHHSDRGSQYTCKAYLKLLRDNNCKISMARSAQDNAYAERINSTIKNEYLTHWTQHNFEDLKRQLREAVKHYNNKRLHNNLKRDNPTSFKAKWETDKKHYNKKMTIFNNEI